MIEEEESAQYTYEDDICHERSTAQWLIFRLFSAQSSVLSILGSSLIIFMVFRRGRDGFAKFQNRLLLPMCVFDIIASIGYAFSTTPIPRGSRCTYGAIGNKATCTAQGFLLTLGLTVPLYNAMLCIYYLLVVKYNISDEAIAKYEFLMHFISIFPPLTTAILAAANDLFNNHIVVCWIQVQEREFLDLEGDSPSDDGAVRNFLRRGILITAAIFAVFVLLTIGYCMISIYKFIKGQELQMSSYQFRRPDGNSSNNARRNNRKRRRSQQVSKLSNTAIDTKKQALLYVCSFILTYTFTSLCILLDVFDADTPYALMLLQGISAPLQGFLNFLAYIRPRFNIISAQHGGKSIFARLYITIFYKPDHSIQSPRGRRNKRRRRRRRLPGQPSMSMKSKKENDAAAVNDPGNLVASSSKHINKNHLTNPSTKILVYQPQQVASIEMQQFEVGFYNESPLNDSPDVHDDEEEPLQLGQSLDNFVDQTPHDLQEAVSLSLLIAEDILPRALHRNNDFESSKERRASMIDRIPINQTESYLERTTNDNVSSTNENYPRKRRYSCS